MRCNACSKIIRNGTANRLKKAKVNNEIPHINLPDSQLTIAQLRARNKIKSTIIHYLRKKIRILENRLSDISQSMNKFLELEDDTQEVSTKTKQIIENLFRTILNSNNNEILMPFVKALCGEQVLYIYIYIYTL